MPPDAELAELEGAAAGLGRSRVGSTDRIGAATAIAIRSGTLLPAARATSKKAARPFSCASAGLTCAASATTEAVTSRSVGALRLLE